MDANKIIDSFGGTRAVAQIFEITDGAVSQWRTNGIPKANLMVLELLRPDLFDQPKKAALHGREARALDPRSAV